MDPDLDRVAVPCERLVDGVVDDLENEVMQTARPGGADVHAGPLADGVEPLENGYVFGAVTSFGQ
jgi:hypothetical protein